MAGKHIKHTPEQKEELVEKICQMYESQNATVASCCEAAGITDRTFSIWVAQNSEFSERYKKAKENQDDQYWQEIIRPLAKTALQRRLEGETKVETKHEGAWKGDGENRIYVETKRTETNVEILPDATLIMFSMKGIYPQMFTERKEISGPNRSPIKIDFDTSDMTTEEKRQLRDLLKKAQNG